MESAVLTASFIIKEIDFDIVVSSTGLIAKYLSRSATNLARESVNISPLISFVLTSLLKAETNSKTARKEKDYGKTINIYQNAARIATSWELTGELEQLNEFIRLIKIEDLRIKMKTLEKEAKLAAKEEKYNEAAQKYKMSSKIASEIFKLGGTELTKEVKRLSNKSKEYEKLI